MKREKIIITLWRGQLNQLTTDSISQPIICRITYGDQSKKSKPADAKKAMVWKQTFVMALCQSQQIKLDFIKLQQGQQIHFAGQQIVDSLSFGHCNIPISVKNSTKGALPVKTDILDENNKTIGKIFLEYEILKAQITYIVQRQMDYLYLLKLSYFRVNFVRSLKRVPNFYLKLRYGDKQQREDFAFNENQGIFQYNYPIKLYLKKQAQLTFELEVRDFFGKDFFNQDPNQSYRTQSYTTQRMGSDKNANTLTNKGTEKSGSKKEKNPIDLINQKVQAIFDLSFKKNMQLHKKLPLFIPVGKGKRQIGSIQFEAQAIFKTKKQLDELQEQLKVQAQKYNKQKNGQKKKKYQPPKNGVINVNSIMIKLEVFNQELLNGKDFSMEVTLGKQTQFSSVLQNPGRQLIFIDTFTYRRTWEEIMKFTLNVHNQLGQRLPSFYAEINLRDLFDIGRFLAKRLGIRDEYKNYCGEMIVDIVYSEEQPNQKQKKREISLSPTKDNQNSQIVNVYKNKTIQQSQIDQKQKKRQQIAQRMKKRELQKQKEKERILGSFDIKDIAPNYSQYELMLPPLRSSRNKQTSSQPTKVSISPSNKQTNNRNVYNRGGSITFSRSPRFSIDKKQHPDSFFYHGESDFENKINKGAFIGYGNKSDFTKIVQRNPGVGRYQIPSLWDKYK